MAGTRGSQVFETPTVNRWLVVLPCNDQRAAAKWRSMEQQWMGQSAHDMGVRWRGRPAAEPPVTPHAGQRTALRERPWRRCSVTRVR